MVTTREQGRSSFLADTDVDADWWIGTLKAHGMGVVRFVFVYITYFANLVLVGEVLQEFVTMNHLVVLTFKSGLSLFLYSILYQILSHIIETRRYIKILI